MHLRVTISPQQHNLTARLLACGRGLRRAGGEAQRLVSEVKTKSSSVSITNCTAIKQQREDVELSVARHVAATDTAGKCGLHTPE